MPHIIDFDGLEQNLFVLQHICYGSSKFCEKISLNRISKGTEDYEWWEYTGLLKSIISNTVIESAVKVRMLQDFIKADDEEIDLNVLDSEACQGLIIGTFIQDKELLTLRESCNKIIHATEARLQWLFVDPDNNESNEYWNGMYDLWGSNRGKHWQLQLNVEAWCIAMIRFNKAVQESVDWYHVYKHDE